MVVDHPLARVLEAVDSSSCPERLNFHCHTLCSDGSLAPEELAEQAILLGLDHFAVTDHHSARAFLPVQRHLDRQQRQGRRVPRLWSGVEISCLLEGCLVHVLGLGFEHDHPALAPYLEGRAVVGPALQAGAVCRAIQTSGGLALLAHPARYRLPHQPLITAAAALGFDGAEAFYDYEQKARWQASPGICHSIAAQLSRLGLLSSCGTDTHGLQLQGR
ncbi:PHP domain-containing protein [Synechococcus sp. CS-1325]|uniref:PHP domain-containing protein n=1 Tax=unclassified Synechococcus TaxID=2626047 RepID=UPI000DB69CC5|nr:MULTISPECIES: PHP domain-containing protein [unclassified Synechococcus]PZV02987.1 MAG: phosphatase [Cyanobium sp.]MCT0199370.1 PHP domain-containing protein [Synechococcus sp. CS-1325]MCT0214427.1 PHP domain-containing protein [Synechococcus sp. CS-1326]MCT0231807.1 PHP domain-containing protein [Synechococcus sp. CS-1324]MCT0233270.1 PHP domain-containing protein [Synechococcus sp. CS-1327]